MKPAAPLVPPCPACGLSRTLECARVECGLRRSLTASPPGGASHIDGATRANINEWAE